VTSPGLAAVVATVDTGEHPPFVGTTWLRDYFVVGPVVVAVFGRTGLLYRFGGVLVWVFSLLRPESLAVSVASAPRSIPPRTIPGGVRRIMIRHRQDMPGGAPGDSSAGVQSRRLCMGVALVCGCSRVVLCSWVNPKGGWLGFGCAGGEAFLWPGRAHGFGSDGNSGRGAVVAGVLAARW
jgi:hypothetical protein